MTNIWSFAMNEAVEKMKQDISAIKMQGTEDVSAEENSQGNKVADSDDGVNNAESGTDHLSDKEQWELNKAIRSGWRPKEEFNGNDTDFLSPRQWNINVALLKRAERAERAELNLRKQSGDFNERVQNVLKVAKANAIAELNEKKKQAVEEADYEQVKKIDKEIDQANEEYEVQTIETEDPPSVRPEVEVWLVDISWYGNDEAMTKFALSFQTAQLQLLENPNNPTTDELETALENTTAAVRQKYPNKFKRQPHAVSHSLEAGSNRKSQRKFTYDDLTPQEKIVCSEMERTGAMKRDDYVQAIKDIREQAGDL